MFPRRSPRVQRPVHVQLEKGVPSRYLTPGSPNSSWEPVGNSLSGPPRGLSSDREPRPFSRDVRSGRVHTPPQRWFPHLQAPLSHLMG